MERLIECVPNFSEGRDKEKINRIVEAITEAGGVKLLDVDPGVIMAFSISLNIDFSQGVMAIVRASGTETLATLLMGAWEP